MSTSGCRAANRIVTSAAFLAVGVGGICWALNSPNTSLAVALVATVAMHVGCGFLREGLKLQSDTAGAPTLIGVAPRRQLLAHLVAPGVGSLMVALPVALSCGWWLTDSTGISVAHTALTCVLTLLLVELSVPVLVVSAGGGLLTGELAGSPTWWPFSVAVLSASGMVWLALAGLDEKTDAHRL